jgi:hypothetical protein
MHSLGAQQQPEPRPNQAHSAPPLVRTGSADDQRTKDAVAYSVLKVMRRLYVHNTLGSGTRDIAGGGHCARGRFTSAFLEELPTDLELLWLRRWRGRAIVGQQVLAGGDEFAMHRPAVSCAACASNHQI